MLLGPGEPEAGPWRMMSFDDFLATLTAMVGTPAGRPPVLAVDGRSSSGKTTLALRVAAARPGTSTVHTDDIAWSHSRFGWADLLQHGVLEPLHRGESVAYRPPAWQSRGRVGSIDVPGDGSWSWSRVPAPAGAK